MTIVLGSAMYWNFLYFTDKIVTNSIVGLYGQILLTVIYTGFCSLPATVFFLLAYYAVNTPQIKPILAKFILLFVGITCCTITLAIMPIVGGDLFSIAQLTKLGFFSFSTLFSILSLRLRRF